MRVGDSSRERRRCNRINMVRDLREPDGANIDRGQIIKGWIDEDGKSFERIYDTVDIEKATFTNTIGAAMLSGHWEDPDFDAKKSAFYYVRVIEIPTPRWTTYDAAFFDIDRPDNVPATVQDRAYTSAIWYSPGS
jgi:hypothetical protein